MTYTEEVVGLFTRNYVNPARERGQATIEVRAGELHSKLGWVRRIPLVCAALSSKKLQKKVGVRLTEKSGPPSGQSPTVIFRYEILDRDVSQLNSVDSVSSKRGLMAAYGAAAHLYRQVGGGDAFLKAQRESFGLSSFGLADSESGKSSAGKEDK